MPLDEALLERLERCLNAQGVPWLDDRRPGLSDDEMDALTAPIGVRLPPELRLWWSWFDGVAEPARRVEITPLLEVLPLDAAIAGRATLREVAAGVAVEVGVPVEEEVERCFPSPFLVLFATGGSVTIAADSSRGPATPLHYVEYHPNPHPLLMLAPSLGDAVHRWVEMYEAGYYRWDRNAERWDLSRFDMASRPTITLI